MKIALLSGTSGLVGMQLLHQLLKNPEYTYIISIGRRQLALKHAKLVQLKTEMDSSHKLDWQQELVAYALGGENNQLRDAIVSKTAEIHAFCSLGTTIGQAKTKENFYTIEHDFVISFAQLASQMGASKFLYVSALGADSTSSVYYNRVKGEIENDLKSLNFDYLGLFRPSLLLGNRTEFRFGEEVAKIFMKPLVWLKLWKNMRPIYDYQVAKAMVKTALHSKSVNVEIVVSAQIQDLSV
jgi:uncharacterized protein YbjT (DUF2867 family)